jgi:hypothetical protein
VRIGLAAAGAGAIFLLVVIALLLWSYFTVDPDRMRDR